MYTSCMLDDRLYLCFDYSIFLNQIIVPGYCRCSAPGSPLMKLMTELSLLTDNSRPCPPAGARDPTPYRKPQAFRCVSVYCTAHRVLYAIHDAFHLSPSTHTPTSASSFCRRTECASMSGARYSSCPAAHPHPFEAFHPWAICTAHASGATSARAGLPADGARLFCRHAGVRYRQGVDQIVVHLKLGNKLHVLASVCDAPLERCRLHLTI